MEPKQECRGRGGECKVDGGFCIVRSGLDSASPFRGLHGTVRKWFQSGTRPDGVYRQRSKSHDFFWYTATLDATNSRRLHSPCLRHNNNNLAPRQPRRWADAPPCTPHEGRRRLIRQSNHLYVALHPDTKSAYCRDERHQKPESIARAGAAGAGRSGQKPLSIQIHADWKDVYHLLRIQHAYHLLRIQRAAHPSSLMVLRPAKTR